MVLRMLEKYLQFDYISVSVINGFPQSSSSNFFKLHLSILQTYFRGRQQISSLTLGEFKRINHFFSPEIIRKRYLYNIKLFVRSTWLTRKIIHFDPLKNLMNKYYLGWYCPSSVTLR